MLAPPPFALGEPLNEGSDVDSLLSIRTDLRIAALGDAPHWETRLTPSPAAKGFRVAGTPPRSSS